MKKTHRLGRAHDIKQLFSRGRRLDFPLFSVSLRRNHTGHARFAFVVPRRVSKKAYIRNRLKRRAREWVRKDDRLSKEPVDIGFYFKSEASGASARSLYKELQLLAKKLA